MTNKHRSTTKHVRSRRARLANSFAGPTHPRPQQQLKIDLARACYSSVTSYKLRTLSVTVTSLFLLGHAW